MKKLLIIICCIFFAVSSASAQGMKFEQTDWASIRKIAKEQHKFIFIDIYTSWCGPCKLLEKTVFPMDTVGNFMNSRFVNVRYDAEKGFGIKIAEKYAPNAYPTFIILNSNGRLINRGGGGSDTKGFLGQIQQLIAKRPDVFATGISDTVELSYPDLYSNFFVKSKRPDSASVVSYLRAQKNWLTEVNWNILSMYGANYLPEYKDWIADHVDDVQRMFAVTIDIDRRGFINEKIQKAIQDKNKANFEVALNQLELFERSSPSAPVKMQIVYSKLKFYARTADWDTFFDQLNFAEQKHGDSLDHYAIKIVLDNTNATAVLERTLTLVKDTKNVDLLADRIILLNTLNKKTEAREAAKDLLNNKDSASVTNAMLDLVYKLGGQAVDKSDSANVFFAADLLQQMNLPDKEMRTQRLFVHYYNSTKQWQQMTKAMDKLIALDKKIMSREINEYAFTIYDQCIDQKSIKSAIYWMKAVVDKDEELKTVFLYTYAALLYKGHQKQKAIDTLNYILAEAKGKVEDTDAVSQLLQKIKNDKH